MNASSEIRIDQVVHGYDRGHRELAASITLDDPSRAKMLVLSDLLTTMQLAGGASYLTGYPLRGASRYVLARTWAAGVGYRPGSVWTHSLILDYQALALIPDLLSLQLLHSEPTSQSLRQFSTQIDFRPTSIAHGTVENGPRAAHALTQLYGDCPANRILLPSVNFETDELLALALWRQMWPSLRRDFSFLTGTGEIPVEFDSDCSLGFAENVQENVGFWTKDSLASGYRTLLVDLPKSGPTPLRTFISRYVIESKAPRKLATKLVSLRDQMSDRKLSERLQEIRLLTSEEPLTRLSRDIFLEELKNSENPQDIVSLIVAFSHEQINIDLGFTISRTKMLSNDELGDLLKATLSSKKGTFGDHLFKEIVQRTALDILCLIASDRTRLKMMQQRPLLAEITEFWPRDDQQRADLIRAAAKRKIVLGLDNGLTVFGLSLGSLTLCALLETTTDVVLKNAVPLLVREDKAVREVFGEWLTKEPYRLAHCVDLLDTLDIEILNALASVQVGSGLPITNPLSWSRIILQMKSFANVSLEIPSLELGFVAALMLEAKDSIALATAVYDELQRAVRNMRLNVTQERYLLAALPRANYGVSLSSLLTRNAISKWSSGHRNLDALAISRNREHLMDLIGEIAARYGRHQLNDLISNSDLSGEARDCIREFVSKAKKKTLLNWWW